jgi:hypothetical protein
MLLLAPEVLGVINVHLMLAMQAIKLPRTIHPLGAMIGKGFHLMINQKQLIQGSPIDCILRASLILFQM